MFSAGSTLPVAKSPVKDTPKGVSDIEQQSEGSKKSGSMEGGAQTSSEVDPDAMEVTDGGGKVMWSDAMENAQAEPCADPAADLDASSLTLRTR